MVAERGIAEGALSAHCPGRPRMASISSQSSRSLDAGWTHAAVPPDLISDPRELAAHVLHWREAIVPGTVASALRTAGALDLEHVPDFDAVDWWFRCRFFADPASEDHQTMLCFGGLATLAEVWLNGEHVISSTNMFLAHEVDVTSRLRKENEIVVCFRSLTKRLQERRPRPRWRSNAVGHQQLRWHRTTLIGRMAGWSPPVKAVGPWRAVRLETRRLVEIMAGDVLPIAADTGGHLDAALTIRALGEARIESAVLFAENLSSTLDLSHDGGDRWTLRGTLPMPDARLWWPHTHGEQPQYSVRIVLETNQGTVEIGFPPMSFRRVEVRRPSDSGFDILLNGASIFCRGSCWTTLDVSSLSGTAASYRHLLTLARDAGMNMLRVGGTMLYEADTFYDICDELGIMVWQDFMFANMDYPVADTGFSESVRQEAVAEVARLRRHPSLTVFCGNSEVEQQAAMMGLGRDAWSSALFYVTLPDICAAGAPGIPYWPASPGGGTLPIHVDSGVAHYYGVGAYLRPLDDARRSNVRFTTECLGFANVPDQAALEATLPNAEVPFHHPRWKARVPRDHGMGWDFDDVRDHYLKELFQVDPVSLRYSDIERYITLSRIVSGEVMGRTIMEWRRRGSTCGGALTWYFQDMWLGAGFGVIDSTGRPKPAYHFLKRAMQPVAISITNEGTNGLHIQLVNDGIAAVDGELTLTLLRGGAIVVASTTTQVRLAARAASCVTADGLLGRFQDTAYAYRFGPPPFDVALATLRDASGHTLGEDYSFPGALPSGRTDDAALDAQARRVSADTMCITLRAARFVTWVALDCGVFIPEDNYFHMAPGTERTILARSSDPQKKFTGYAHPASSFAGISIPVVTTSRDDSGTTT